MTDDTAQEMTPRDYLLARGWQVDEQAESYALELPRMRPWTDPVYEGRYDLHDAFGVQVQWDVERLGGFEALISLSDSTGKELQF